MPEIVDAAPDPVRHPSRVAAVEHPRHLSWLVGLGVLLAGIGVLLWGIASLCDSMDHGGRRDRDGGRDRGEMHMGPAGFGMHGGPRGGHDNRYPHSMAPEPAPAAPAPAPAAPAPVPSAPAAIGR